VPSERHSTFLRIPLEIVMALHPDQLFPLSLLVLSETVTLPLS